MANKNWHFLKRALLPMILMGLTSIAQARGNDCSGFWIFNFWKTPGETKCTYGPVTESATADTESASFVQSLISKVDFTRDLRSSGLTLNVFSRQSRLNKAFLLDPTYKGIMQASPSMRFLYGEYSGVSEGFTIGEHTVRVLQVYENQKIAYDIKSIPLPASIGDIETVMKYTLAFHDIGKSIAQRGGDKGLEVEYSGPISEVLMKTAGFSPSAVKLTRALIHSHQVIGLYLQGRVSLKDSITAAKNAAIYAEVNPAEFFKLMEIVFVCDAGSYDMLRQNVFELAEDGRLQPQDQETYQELREGIINS
jgi:hypothetical protein